MQILILNNLYRGFSIQTSHIHSKFAHTLSQFSYEMVIVAGNLASHRRHHYKACLAYLHAFFKGVPILVTDGNRDIWDKTQKSIIGYLSIKKKWRKQYSIHSLSDDGPYKQGKILIQGIDNYRLNTKDKEYVPELVKNTSTELYLNKLTTDQIRKLDPRPEYINILVSYYLDYNIIKGFEYYIVGNSHKPLNTISGATTILCAGSSYDTPRATIIEV